MKTGMFGATAAPMVNPNNTARHALYVNFLPNIALRGLQTKEDNPMAMRRPPVERLTISVLVSRSAAISGAAESSEVEEKVAASVDHDVTKTMMPFRQSGMLL